MPSRYYRYNSDGEILEEIGVAKSSEPVAPYVHDDTLAKPLRNLVTGTIHTSKSAYLAEVRKTGHQVVGNDWVGNMTKHDIRDKITDNIVIDRTHKAEAILSDPSRRRAHINRNLELNERHEKFLKDRCG